MGDVIKIDTRTGEYVERVTYRERGPPSGELVIASIAGVVTGVVDSDASCELFDWGPMNDRQSDFGPTASWDQLRRRAELLRTVRRFFDERGFLEVETPLLSHDYGRRTATSTRSSVRLFDDPRAAEQGPLMWLQTSPEFGMKRLLAAGADGHLSDHACISWRRRGPLHNPEFTMVEWYRVGDDMQAGMHLLDELAQATLSPRSRRAAQLRRCFRALPWASIHIGVPLQQLVRNSHPARLPRRRRRGTYEDRDAWLDWLLVSHVEPTLGVRRPTILFDYPASQAALARVRERPFRWRNASSCMWTASNWPMATTN